MDAAQPDWAYCGHGSGRDSDPVGCRGILVTGYARCLAHLTPEDRTTYLSSVRSGDDVDHRGTPFSEDLLRDLLNAHSEPGVTGPVLGETRFDWAYFPRHANFNNITFDGSARFDYAIFRNTVRFDSVTFAGPCWFPDTQFKDRATFDCSVFHNDAWFGGAHFHSNASFTRSVFTGAARFYSGVFSGYSNFKQAEFIGTTWFTGVEFTGATNFEGSTFNQARFDGSCFWGDARFAESTFNGEAGFTGVEFYSLAEFHKATFSTLRLGDKNGRVASVKFHEKSRFSEVTFNGETHFERVAFSGESNFSGASFASLTRFDGAIFRNNAYFDFANFGEHTWFYWVNFTGNASFDGATFSGVQPLGPLACQGELEISRATFTAPVTIDVAATSIRCQRTQWESTAALRLRHATIDLSDSVLTSPLSVSASAGPIPQPVDFPHFAGSEIEWSQSVVKVSSLRGVDCALLSLIEVDLAKCRFSGALHLDQLRLEGHWILHSPPQGWFWHYCIPRHWTRRQVVEEERRWRALSARSAPERRGWGFPPQSEHEIPGLTAIAVIYRQLRKAREDAKDEPGAADFYYGEMEMRRHSHTWYQAERWLLQGYWMLSGYGLRASRAIGWLLLAMAATVIIMMGKGIPDETPKHEIARVQEDGKMRTVIKESDPDLTLPLRQRFTGERFEKSLRTVINSVIFRSSGQGLTTWGTYAEMVCRFAEPVFLGFAALAIRGRLKRGN